MTTVMVAPKGCLRRCDHNQLQLWHWHRGCKALNVGGVVTNDSMTHGPAIDFPSVAFAAAANCGLTQ
jgi:hypothetical protein